MWWLNVGVTKKSTLTGSAKSLMGWDGTGRGDLPNGECSFSPLPIGPHYSNFAHNLAGRMWLGRSFFFCDSAHRVYSFVSLRGCTTTYTHGQGQNRHRKSGLKVGGPGIVQATNPVQIPLSSRWQLTRNIIEKWKLKFLRSIGKKWNANRFAVMDTSINTIRQCSAQSHDMMEMAVDSSAYPREGNFIKKEPFNTH